MRRIERKARGQASVSEPPAIVLSGIRGSYQSEAFYCPKDNKILLTYGVYPIPYGKEEPEEAEHCIEVLKHELAHWATFLYLAPKQRMDVTREYDERRRWLSDRDYNRFIECDHILLERIAWHVSNW